MYSQVEQILRRLLVSPYRVRRVDAAPEAVPVHWVKTASHTRDRNVMHTHVHTHPARTKQTKFQCNAHAQVGEDVEAGKDDGGLSQKRGQKEPAGDPQQGRVLWEARRHPVYEMLFVCLSSVVSPLTSRWDATTATCSPRTRTRRG